MGFTYCFISFKNIPTREDVYHIKNEVYRFSERPTVTCLQNTHVTCCHVLSRVVTCCHVLSRVYTIHVTCCHVSMIQSLFQVNEVHGTKTKQRMTLSEIQNNVSPVSSTEFCVSTLAGGILSSQVDINILSTLNNISLSTFNVNWQTFLIGISFCSKWNLPKICTVSWKLRILLF